MRTCRTIRLSSQSEHINLSLIEIQKDCSEDCTKAPLIRHAVLTPATSVSSKSVQEERLGADQCSSVSVRQPPVFIFVISLLQLGTFIYYSMEQCFVLEKCGLIYNPYRRFEMWRYVTYMFVHKGDLHIITNIFNQLVLGIPLEIVHSWWRVMVVYLAGILAGSLTVSIIDPTAFLCGASAGGYALITAHLASVILNWYEQKFPWFRIIGIATFALLDVGVAIYNHLTGHITRVSYSGHAGGAVAGLLVGIIALRNRRKLKWEKVVTRISLFVFAMLMFSAIIYNIFFPQKFFHSRYD